MHPTARHFWLAQSLGWGLFALGNGLLQGLIGVSVPQLLLNSGLGGLTGLLISSLYRYPIRRIDWSTWGLKAILVMLLAASLLLAMAWNLLLGLIFIQLMEAGSQIWAQLLPNLFNGYLIFLIWNLIYFFFQYFLRYRQAEVERYRAESAERKAQLQALEAQLNPHFVFNTLNNIRSLVLEDQARARHMLGNFSALFRYALHHARQTTVLVEEEMAIVQQYLELMAIHYEDRLQYHLDFSPEVEEASLPPMLVHALVENAIKHGISRHPGRGDLTVSLQPRDQSLHLRVSNTGELQSASPDSGTGLAVLRERLALLYGEQASLSLYQAGPAVVAEVSWPRQRLT